MRESAARLAGGNATFRFGRDQLRTFAEERAKQVAQLRGFPRFELSGLPHLGTGGEHKVFAQQQAEEDRVVKVTLSGMFGRTMDEDILFDSRTFLNSRKLRLRDALPSEYLLRWALLDGLFGLESRLLGVTGDGGAEPQLVISQRYIGQDMPDQGDVDALMFAMGFEKVEPRHVINPENEEVTWYRQRDGLLITDAFDRNFRLDRETGAVIPIDLMVTIVPPGASTILPPATEPFALHSF